MPPAMEAISKNTNRLKMSPESTTPFMPATMSKNRLRYFALAVYCSMYLTLNSIAAALTTPIERSNSALRPSRTRLIPRGIGHLPTW